MSRGRDNANGRGKGSKSKIEGRISGYETADFSIANPSENVSMTKAKTVSSSSLGKEKKKLSLGKKIGLAFGFIIVILFLIGKLSHSHDRDFHDSNSQYSSSDNFKVITPENAKVKPTSFTQRQLDAEDSRDQKIEELLKDGWTMNNNEAPTDDDYITVGKKWDAISTNLSPVINVTTSYEYEYKEQKYGTSTLTLNLQEAKGNAGIDVDSTVTNILKIYNPDINMDSINSSVQAAYDAAHNSKPYQGSLSFDKDYIYINSKKSGQLITVTIDVNTSISVN
ncbi:hypothetical protein CLOBY_35140 [Clostridium saccharobutylicum]|uniref:hypothetical protein n=2 Tax=Clostridium saccharobutylicum TaxID=169679 RepID=UPI000983BF24|nr:hypothetical protein [Clostridium saccharobutylicum]AQS11358.1 hypothetical protein CLOBY_35140 [Clostridium saccharobutylicum]NSB88754.1 hypothetical protein [Clostridium saccharobutylicum]NYC30668.1 hypothetical protein [Clostridium saccharobutylicum]OOM15448.1 hypothetical protein CLSAB_27180 [Clostridium saccharobutylicum]